MRAMGDLPVLVMNLKSMSMINCECLPPILCIEILCVMLLKLQEHLDCFGLLTGVLVSIDVFVGFKFVLFRWHF